MKYTEADTKFQRIDPLIRNKGYTDYVHLEHQREGDKTDYDVVDAKGEYIAIIEAKRETHPLNQEDQEQTFRYGESRGVKIAFLTNSVATECWYIPTKSRFKIDGAIVQGTHALPDYKQLLVWVRDEKEGNYITPSLIKEELMGIDEALNEIDSLFHSNEGINKNKRMLPTNTLLAIVLFERARLLDKIRIEIGLSLKDIANAQTAQRAKMLFVDSLWPKLERDFPAIFDRTRTSCAEVQNLKPETIQSILKILLKVDFNDSDKIGEVNEYFLNRSSIKNDQGQYFTPRELTRLSAHILDYKLGDKIIDPFAGTMGFGIAAFKHLEQNINPDDLGQKSKLKNDTIFGVEKEKDTYTCGVMNLFIAGDGMSNVEMNDSLAGNEGILENGQYDKVPTNIPFTGDVGRVNYLTETQKAQYIIRSDNAEILAIQKSINLLKPSGTSFVIIPVSALTKMDGEFVQLRRLLLENYSIKAIIELPQFTFTHTPAAAAILVVEKTKVEIQRTLFMRLQYLGYSLDKDHKVVSQNDLPRAKKIWDSYRAKEKVEEENASVREYRVVDLGEYCKLGVSIFLDKGGSDSSISLADLIKESALVIKEKGGTKIKGPIKILKTRYIRWGRHTLGRSLCHVEWDDKARKSKESNIEKNSTTEKRLVREGDILFCHSGQGTIGKVALVEGVPPRSCVVEDLMWNIRVLNTERIDRVYLYYVLATKFKEKECMGKQMGTARITEKWELEQFKAVQFELPSIEKQREIVDQLKRAMNVEFENLKLYESFLKGI